MRSSPQKLLRLMAVAFGCCVVGLLVAEESKSVPQPNASLRTALGVNLDYCEQWLAAKDFKTLEQTAGGLEILAHTLAAKSDDAAWQQAIAELLTSSRELQAAARAKNHDTSRDLIKQYRRQTAALPAPGGRPKPPSRGKTGLKTMMALLEGTLADAKTNVAVGDVENAKISADVLKELGQTLSNYKSGENWTRWSREFAEAANQAARHPADDAKGLRAQLKIVHEACENCHDKR